MAIPSVWGFNICKRWSHDYSRFVMYIHSVCFKKFGTPRKIGKHSPDFSYTELFGIVL